MYKKHTMLIIVEVHTFSPVNPISRIGTYLIKISPNIVITSTPHLPRQLFPVSLPAKILKAPLTFFNSGNMPCPSASTLIALTILANVTNYEVSHCEAFSTPHPHPFWVQIFASGPCSQIPLACDIQHRF